MACLLDVSSYLHSGLSESFRQSSVATLCWAIEKDEPGTSIIYAGLSCAWRVLWEQQEQ